MRQSVLVAFLSFSTLLAHAQRGGGHAMAGGHAGFSGGFSGRSGQSFSHAAPQFTAPSHSSLQRGYDSGSWTSAGFIPSHSGLQNSNRGRQPGRRQFGYGGVGYPLYGFPGLGSYGNGYEDGDGGQQANASVNQQEVPYSNENQDGGPPQEAYGGTGDPTNGWGPAGPPRAPYNPGGGGNAVPQAQTPASDGLQHPPVTLVFRDGHRLVVQNYAVTQTKVLVTDNSTVKDIPIAALDVAATAAANDSTGVDFPLLRTQ